MAMVNAFGAALANRSPAQLETARTVLIALSPHLQRLLLDATKRHDTLAYLCALWSLDAGSWSRVLTSRLWDQNQFPDMPVMHRFATFANAAGLFIAPNGSGRLHVFGQREVMTLMPGRPRKILCLQHTLVDGIMDAQGSHLWIRAADNCAYHLGWSDETRTLTQRGLSSWYNAGSDERAFIVEHPAELGRPLGITRHQLNFLAIRPLEWIVNGRSRQPQFQGFDAHLLFLSAKGSQLAWCPSEWEVCTACIDNMEGTTRALLRLERTTSQFALLQSSLSVLGTLQQRIFIGDTWGRVHWWDAATLTHHVIDTHLALVRRIWASPNALRLAVLSNSNLMQIFLYHAESDSYRSLRTVDIETLFEEPRPFFDWRTLFVALDDDSCLALQDNLTATAMLWMFGPSPL